MVIPIDGRWGSGILSTQRRRGKCPVKALIWVVIPITDASPVGNRMLASECRNPMFALTVQPLFRTS